MPSTNEVELKSVVPDLEAARRQVEAAGARLVFAGRLEDRRYDTGNRVLARCDHVLRLRVYHNDGERRGWLDWKGPTAYEKGYKVREELSTGIVDPAALALILERLGYVLTRELDREIVQYEVDGAMVRFETYPRMDVLVEVEGTPSAIERAIAATGLPRAGFTTDRLPAFVARFERRTGERAAICRRELAGDYRFRSDDA
jgi:predicted adenylyl cyclase CyaB